MGKSLRDVYGDALLRYGGENDGVVVLDADVSGSTKSGVFGAAFPQRFFNVGIAEANMVGMAAGFAAAGKIPFVNTFAVFLSTIGLIGARAFGSYSQLNIKFMGAYGGLSDSYDGPSHHSLEDLAIMRTLPHFRVYAASDEHQTGWLVKHAVETDGPMYIRLSRGETRTVYTLQTSFQDGKGMIVRSGSDVSIIACGVMVGEAVKAAEELEKKGVSARVVDMFCLKPLDEELILRCAGETGAIVTAEEHSVIGGLGGAVAEVLSRAGAGIPHAFVGVGDRHAECGPYDGLLAKYGLDASAIAAAAERAISMKKTALPAGEIPPGDHRAKER